MTMRTGKRLGPYEITAPIGAGGMGEVYLATDTKLKRDIAIKVLPAELAGDRDRLARFEREAHLLASLNHPHIASIYGLEESNGVPYLVLEYVEGRDLSQVLQAGAIPLEDVPGIGLQIAEALEAAHERGIVHRDLKPANVKITSLGAVKVLDFGLAKALVDDASDMSRDSSLSPTLTAAATRMGVIIGTAGYMSPEQAKGKSVDRRADIWSFGVLLFEMVSGRRCFSGETVSETLASVLKEDPDWSALPDTAPPQLLVLLRRCLEKNPRRRLQSIGEARVILEDIQTGTGATVWDPGTGARGPTGDHGDAPRRRVGGTMAVIGALALGIGIITGALLLAPGPAPVAPLRLELAIPAGLQLTRNLGHPLLAISATGRKMALAVIDEGESAGLLLRDLGELQPRRLEGTEGGRAPFFSPDEEWIGFFNAGALLKIAVAGGSPIRLAEVDERSRGGVWGKDGFIYFSPDTGSGIHRVSEAGGPVEKVTDLDGAREERTHRWPDLSPDGQVLVYTSDTAATPTYYDDARIEAVRLATGERHVLVEGASQARMLADDILVYANAGNLFALEIDPRTLTARGRPVTLEQNVATNVGAGAVQFAVSRSGSGVWLMGTVEDILDVPQWYERDGTSGPSSIPEMADMNQMELSPDGRRVAVRTGGTAGTQSARSRDIWIGDLERGTLTRLTFDEVASFPTWSPDGSRVAYARDVRPETAAATGLGRGIIWKPADGSGEPEVLLDEPGMIQNPLSFSPDGRQLVFVRWSDKTKNDLWILPLDPPGEPRPLLASPYDEDAATISPDGRWIAYLSNESGRAEVYVRPLSGESGKWQISTTGGFEPRWSRAANEMFFRTGDGRLASVTFEGGSTFRASPPRVLWQQGELLAGGSPKSYGITPDGMRFLALRSFDGPLRSPVINYSDEWVLRARRLLAPRD